MSGKWTDAELDAIWHDAHLRDLGVIEDDEPTAVSHALWMAAYRERACGEFTAEERHRIRLALGLMAPE